MSADLTVRVKQASKMSTFSFAGTLRLDEFRTSLAAFLGLGCASFLVLTGFPPRPIDFTSSPSVAISALVANNEVIRIEAIPLQQRSNEPSVPSKAAAISSKIGTSKSAKGSVKAVKSVEGVRFGAKIATLKPTAAPRATKKVAAKAGSRTTLAGCAASSSRIPAPKRRRMTKFTMSSKEDVGDQLLKAASGGGGDRKDKFMRAVFRRAVELEYDQATAHSRVAAALGGRFNFEDTANVLGNGEATEMRVTFAKGMGSRLMLEDTVDFLSTDKLKAVVMFILGASPSTEAQASDAAESEFDADSRQMLKPSAMAGCSPRVFWSLVRHFGGDIIHGLSTLVPAQNWSWLSERPRRLSEKAAANAEMKREQDQERLRRQQQAARGQGAGESKASEETADAIAAPSELTSSVEASVLSNWMEEFRSLQAREQLLPILAEIVQSKEETIDILSKPRAPSALSREEIQIYTGVLLKLFTDDSCQTSFGAADLVSWANTLNPVEAHLNWSGAHHKRSRHYLTADSAVSSGPNPNIVHSALTVWNFYDIIYGARVLVMKKLWSGFCHDVFIRPCGGSDTAVVELLFQVSILVALSVDSTSTLLSPLNIMREVRPRDLALWRLSAGSFRSKLQFSMQLCKSCPHFSACPNFEIADEAVIKLSCEKMQSARSDMCSWIDEENWCFMQGLIQRIHESESSTQEQIGGSITILNNHIKLASSEPTICAASIAQSAYAEMIDDLKSLFADEWVINCPKARITRHLLMSRAANRSCEQKATVQDGSHFVGELVNRKCGSDENQESEVAIIIAFGPASSSSDSEGDSSEEDIPLWKIQYGDGEREDLEEHEVLRAMSDLLLPSAASAGTK